METPLGLGWLVAVVLILDTFAMAPGKETIQLGVLLPFGMPAYPQLAPRLQHTVNFSVNDVYEQGWLPRDYELQYTIKNSACDDLKAVGSVDDLRSVHAFIGPACSGACLSAALLASHRNKPMISYSCSSTELTNRDRYPTFLRTQPYSRSFVWYTGRLLDNLMMTYNWSRASIICQENEIWPPVADELHKSLLRSNRTVSHYRLYEQSETFETYTTELQDAMKLSRVVFLLANNDEVARYLIAADELGMRNGAYAFITMDFQFQSSWMQPRPQWTQRVDAERFVELFNGIINLSVKVAHGPRKEAFEREITQLLKSKNISVDTMILEFSGFLHDAIELYAVALNLTLDNGGNLTDGRAIVENVTGKGILFTGVTGDVALYDGSRMPVYLFSNRQNNTMVPLIEVDPIRGGIPTYYQTTPIWPGGTKVVPLDEPKCGFQGEKCRVDPTEVPPDDYTALAISSTVVPVVIIIILLFGLLYYRKQLYEKDLMSSSWIISYNDIALVNQGSGRFSTGRVKSQAHSLVSGIGEVDIHSSNLGRYKGELVVMRRFGVNSISLTREIRAEVKKVRDLQHSNLNQFLGFCNEAPNVCMLSVYCQRGTLQDLLANDDFKIDWMFRISFANDIASGMVALHNSPVECHGNLKSCNCFIDGRWVCKVADFGMDTLKFKLKSKEEDREEYARFRELFWTAPELLPKSGSARGGKKTQSGDVYSYAIILHEILTRDEPYSSVLLMTTPEEIVEKVRMMMTSPCRPEIPYDVRDECDPRYVKLILACWDDQANCRPSFREIKSRLKEVNKGSNMNIVDNMIQMMEKYTDQLELLVDERTKQLAEEKAKTDELLYKMLPRPIAEELKAGKAINAESFTGVTIYFSDIVGFTRLAAQSTPMEVVRFLNELYTCFDGVIDEHDVYKVETIGDAYMVVSGLPVPNGDKHAGEIATMALNLLSSVRDFTVSHLGTKVQMRIGIHTGPCVAGVVGLKMPRYCLFGDTVNYASRMESSGLALRVHVSPECKEVLDTLGGYHLQERGPVSMKGKGTIVTYFLTGKDGFNKPLPDLKDATRPEDHEFK